MVKNAFYYTDCSGDKWTDPSGMYSEVPQSCFICAQLTHRIDVSLEAFFCDYPSCNNRLEIDLLKAQLSLPEGTVRWDAGI
jgi:hypothetical protein